MQTQARSLQQRLADLDPGRRQLLMDLLHARAGETADPAHEGTPRDTQRLVGFVLPAPGGGCDPQVIDAYLRTRLPEHMVPQQLVVLESLPRTAAGKLDRPALAQRAPAPSSAPRAGSAVQTAPATDEATETLCRIWAEVLGLSEVGPHEDFFELGGDSLLSIRILARANQAGLHISAEQFFDLPTVAQQAAVARSKARPRHPGGAVTGPVPLLPIQHWFHEHVQVDPHHWNQSMLFRLKRPVHVSALEAAVQALLLHHDGLRLQPGAPDLAGQRVVEPSLAVPVSRVVLDADTTAAHIDSMREHARAQNAALDFDEAPLLRVVLFESGEDGSQHLLVIAHHFLVDQVAWRILLEDLETALAATEAGRPVRLPEKSSSLADWSRRLMEHADSARARAELEHWRRCAELPALLPNSRGDREEFGTEGDMRTHISSLDPHCTAALLRDLPSRLRARTHEIVLSAFALALGTWCGSRALRFDQEGHGREALFDDLDVSRTVGWLTCVFPLRLELPPQDASAAHTLRAVRDQRRAVPDGGIGFGVLRHLCSDESVRSELRSHPRSQVLFNYLGQVDDLAPYDGRLAQLDPAFGTPRSERAPRAYLLEVNAFVEDARLRVLWTHDPGRHDPRSIETLAGAFEHEVDRLIRSDADHTPSPADFPMADLAQDDLDRLADVLKSIDDTP